MKQVIDVGFLRDSRLDDYLKRNHANFAVLTDYACMECYKGNSLYNLRQNLEIISNYPSQVIILKNTRKIVQQKNTTKGIQKRMVDQKQTKGFALFCKQIKQKNIDFSDLYEKHYLASDFFDGLMNGHQKIIDGIQGIGKSLTKEQLKMLTGRQKPSHDLIDRLMKDILYLTGLLMRDHPDVKTWPDSNSLRSHFVFRYGVAAYALGLKWIIDKGIQNVKKQKLRNDMVDISYIAYASYFDGLLTKDKKIKDVYLISNALLEIFN